MASPNTEFKHEDLAVVKLKDSQVMIKEIHLFDGKILLHSFNPKYDDMDFTCRALGFVNPIVMLKKGI